MTEPHAGTDVANYRTNAAIKGDRVVLNGTKTLISRAREAGMFVVFTRIDGRPGREGIGWRSARARHAGLRRDRDLSHDGRRKTCTRSSSTMRIADRELVIREDGFRKLLTAFNTQRCLNPSISLGLARRRVRGSAQLRQGPDGIRQGDRRLPGHPLEACRNVSRHRGARSILYRACLTANPFPIRSWRRWPRSLQRDVQPVTSEAIQLHGGFGFTA